MYIYVRTYTYVYIHAYTCIEYSELLTLIRADAHDTGRSRKAVQQPVRAAQIAISRGTHCQNQSGLGIPAHAQHSTTSLDWRAPLPAHPRCPWISTSTRPVARTAVCLHYASIGHSRMPHELCDARLEVSRQIERVTSDKIQNQNTQTTNQRTGRPHTNTGKGTHTLHHSRRCRHPGAHPHARTRTHTHTKTTEPHPLFVPARIQSHTWAMGRQRNSVTVTQGKQIGR